MVQSEPLDRNWICSLASTNLPVRRAHDFNAVDQAGVVLQLAVKQSATSDMATGGPATQGEPVGVQLLECGHRDIIRAEEQHAAL